MKHIVVNCQKVAFGNALGVVSYLLNLCSALSHNHKLIFALNNLDEFQKSPGRAFVENIAHDIISLGSAQRQSDGLRRSAIELLPHHFQRTMFCERSALICHDLHIFDIPWKYKDVDRIRDDFRKNLLSASAVVAYFPRTYYALERTAGITLMNLFLTESPLMLDTRQPAQPVVERPVELERIPKLLYPAQLQAHKNHEILIRAVQKLKEKGTRIRIVCPGTDFDAGLTTNLKALARRCDVEHEVQIVRRLSDQELIDLYWSCDGVIVPSLAEGGAYVPMEAIAAGKPVAVNQIEAARMHIKAIAGEVIWFDALDLDQAVDAIEQLVNADSKVWFDRNAVARERISQMTWDGVASKWSIFIDWLSGQRDRPILSVDREDWRIAYS